MKKKNKHEVTLTLRYYQYDEGGDENISMERSVALDFDSIEDVFEAMQDLENVGSSLTEKGF